eukprot:TRINITY_DN832_c0_g2_i2.p1 TRINITY_DN832_c0_g2~~TRINITY_DN832_c0_g2_i2.p1  ORF type:complete len:509 (+),score=56.19 TRINITY_DN832_c0_g2_i2:83-1528(+)
MIPQKANKKKSKGFSRCLIYSIAAMFIFFTAMCAILAYSLMKNPVKTSERSPPSFFSNVPPKLKKYLYSVKVPNMIVQDQPGEDSSLKEKRERVKQAFIHAYEGYEKRCMGHGEVKPVSGKCFDWMYYAKAPVTLIDSLDTMLIMNLTEHYARARDWLGGNLKSWQRDSLTSFFEITIRCVGGMLSAYAMTEDPWYLSSTVELADSLLQAFNTPLGIPKSYINLKTGRGIFPKWASSSAILAEMGSFQVEFAYLSHITKDNKYIEKATNIYNQILNNVPDDYLFPVYISPTNFEFKSDLYTLGRLSDSFYEYLLKYWLVTNRTYTELSELYYKSAESLINKMAVKVDEKTWYVGEFKRGQALNNIMEHLTCFAGGMFALGAQYMDDPYQKSRVMEISDGIAHFCYKMYSEMPSKLSCEQVVVKGNGKIEAGGQKSWLMRPEAVETWFVMYRLTKDEKYRQWGYELLEVSYYGSLLLFDCSC